VLIGKKSSCNCKSFLKNYICHHIIGLAYRYKLLEIPDNAKTIPIGKKRPKGRPPTRKPALFYQPDIPQPTQVLNNQQQNETGDMENGDDDEDNDENKANTQEAEFDFHGLRAEDIDVQKAQTKALQKQAQNAQALETLAENTQAIEPQSQKIQATQSKKRGRPKGSTQINASQLNKSPRPKRIRKNLIYIYNN
jgi:hypothetical protein